MKLYLDDDSADRLLGRLLRQALHDVQVPLEAGLAGRSDPVHLTHAVAVNRVFLSANHIDFRELHDLIVESGGSYSGIIIVRSDNDRRRDLTPRSIVRALGNLLASGVPLKNHFVILNQWR